MTTQPTSESDLLALAGNPRDECECGDWREDHKSGTGACRYNGRGFDMCHGGMDCMKFRLAARALQSSEGEG